MTSGESKSPAEHILCPVRGAKRSLETVERAIDLADEHGAKLTFLFVADVDFLGYATVARVKVMLDELKELLRETDVVLGSWATRTKKAVRNATRLCPRRAPTRSLQTSCNAAFPAPASSRWDATTAQR